MPTDPFSRGVPARAGKNPGCSLHAGTVCRCTRARGEEPPTRPTRLRAASLLDRHPSTEISHDPSGDSAGCGQHADGMRGSGCRRFLPAGRVRRGPPRRDRVHRPELREHIAGGALRLRPGGRRRAAAIRRRVRDGDRAGTRGRVHREPLLLDLAETRAKLRSHGLRLSLRYAF